jgi:CheY-like chemotaxis protein
LLKSAQDAVALGSKLTDQLLTFARRRQMDTQFIQLNELVVSITDMLLRTLGEHIALSTSLARDVWPTRADPSQFQSAIVNMAVNARDAMPYGGRLVVETRNIELDADDADLLPDLKSGQYVQLSISDTGAGMPPEIRDRVFEPFFTTKGKGRGTGLGLAMIYGFVKQSGGHVTIYSEVGQGTTINLYFPRTEDAPAASTHEGGRRLDPQAREIILVVEDDERVRQLTIRRLKTIGYQVVEASDGPTALDILRSGEPVDLVFTDLVMPGGLSGRDVVVQAREIKPGIKVLLTSGYAEELVRGDDLVREQLTVLRKPYQQADLVAALRRILGGSADHPAC